MSDDRFAADLQRHKAERAEQAAQQQARNQAAAQAAREYGDFVNWFVKEAAKANLKRTRLIVAYYVDEFIYSDWERKRWFNRAPKTTRRVEVAKETPIFGWRIDYVDEHGGRQAILVSTGGKIYEVDSAGKNWPHGSPVPEAYVLKDVRQFSDENTLWRPAMLDILTR